MIQALRQAIRIVHEFVSNPLRIEQTLTVLKASAVIGSFAYSVYLLDFYVYSRHIEAPPLSLAAAFLTIQSCGNHSPTGGLLLYEEGRRAEPAARGRTRS